MEVLNLARDLFAQVKQRHLRCIVGGGITPKSVPFLETLGDDLDGFETRKIVFTDFAKARQNLEEGIKLALNYELCWYELKRQYYGEHQKEDDSKIKGLEVYRF